MRVHAPRIRPVLHDGHSRKCDERGAAIEFFSKKKRSAPLFLLLALLRFLSDRIRSVAGQDPACRPGDDGFILEPEESEIVDALRKIRLDDDVRSRLRPRRV